MLPGCRQYTQTGNRNNARATCPGFHFRVKASFSSLAGLPVW